MFTKVATVFMNAATAEQSCKALRLRLPCTPPRGAGYTAGVCSGRHSKVVLGVKEAGYFLASAFASPPGLISPFVSGLRRDSPLRGKRMALCTTRSKMASA